MKTSISNLIKFCLFVCLTIFLTLKIGLVFIPENGDKKIQGVTYTINGYYKLKENSIDILFLGDSSMLRAVSPMELWNNAGIASYNYSVTSVRTYGLYYILKDALKTQKPKIVAIDPITMFYHYNVNEENQRISMDYLENNLTKLEMINDPHFENTFEDKVSFIFPLLRYHSRWNEMELNEIEKINKDYTSVTRGFLMSYAVKPNKLGYKYMEKVDNSIKFENDSDIYLMKIKELCDENNIKLMILGFEDSVVWGKTQSELISDFSEKNNIDYIDFNYIDYGLNWNEDTKDGGNHLNVLGAVKLSKYLTTYLKENYELEDHREDNNYDDWNKDYKLYKETLDKYINAAQKKVQKNATNTETNK